MPNTMSNPSSNSASKVEYRKIGKSYGNVEVMRDISFSIEEKEFVVLLGPSGCGKTTLLRMTAGLETVTKGELQIGGERMNEVHPRDRDIAMVFQNYALYPTMKVYDNIAFSLEVIKLPKDEIKKRVEQAAEILNLTDYLDRYPKELSGGQRQRVAMGRAMVRDAEVFLFDEPLSNLDAKLRAHMRKEIRQLHDRLETTTIYVTHDQIEAMTMADKIVLLHDGKIQQIGSPDEVYDQPANLFVADFIGSPAMNFFEGEISGTGKDAKFTAGDLTLPLPKFDNIKDGQSVVMGLRPDDLKLAPRGKIKGEVSIVETMGATIQVTLDVAGYECIAQLPREDRPKRGDKLAFTIEKEKIHIFDKTSELRIS